MLGRTLRPRFEIWQVGRRIHSVDNPVRLKILQLLEAKERSLTEMVLHTRKAKSTLSAVHVPALLQAGLVEERTDPKDARVKRYRLLGHRLGSSDVGVGELRDAVLDYVQTSGALPLPALLAVVDPRALAASGARAAYVEGVARRVGQALGRMLTATEPRAAFAELKAMLETAGLADLDWPAAGAARIRARQADLQAFVDAMARAALDARFPGILPLGSGSRRAPGAAAVAHGAA